MTGAAVLATSLLNALIIGFVARRMLGVPVGWPRTILLSLVVNGAMTPALEWLLRTLDLDANATGTQRIVLGLVSLLAIAWVLTIQASILTVLEALVPTCTLPSPVAFVRSLRGRRRRAVRYGQILAIATKHGLGRFLRFGTRGTTTDGRSQQTLARSVRSALTDGGVTFVKLGQMLSTRPDLLPPAFVEELSHLQSDAPPEPWSEIEQIIRAELGTPIENAFAEVDHEPLAAASVAQIHTARLLDGTEVVLKVQRPRARAQATADLDIVLRLGDRLQRSTGWGRSLRTHDLATGFADSLNEELDYRVELANMRAIAASSPELHIPVVHEELSGPRLLVMERLTGTPLSRASAELAALTPEARREAARKLFGAILRQVVVTGQFHADLHPGNILLAPDGSLGLLDFGAVGRLDQGARHSLAVLLQAVDRGDAIAATDALIDLLDRPADLDDRAVERDIGQLMLRIGPSGPAGGSAELFTGLLRLVVRHGFAVPTQLAAAFRALGALEGSLRLLDPALDIVSVARDEGRGIAQEQFTPVNVRATLEAQLASILPMLQRLPRRVDRITDQLETGRFSVTARVLAHPDDRAFVTGVLQQLVMTVLAAALAIAGVFLIVDDGGPVMTPGLPVFTFSGLVLMLFAFVLGARALVLVFRRRE